MKKANGTNTRLEKKERRENTIITLEEKCFSRNTGIVKTLRDYRRLKKYLMCLRIHAENYFLSLINLWLGSSYLFPICGSNRSHLTISSYRSIEASNGMPEPRHDCGTFKGNEQTRASDNRENTDGAIIRDNREFCERLSQEHRGAAVDDSTFEPLNCTTSVLGKLSVDKFLPNEYRNDDLRRRTFLPERERMKDTFVVMNTVASIKEKPKVERLPSDVISLPFWREELPDAEKRPVPSMRFLIVDEILL